MKDVCSTEDCENAPRPNQWYCRECHAGYMRKQRADGKVKKRVISNDERIKNHARNMVNNAIRDGKLEKQTECEQCGSSRSIEKHHPDYSKPMEIVWLCKLCHEDLHANEAKIDKTG